MRVDGAAQHHGHTHQAKNQAKPDHAGHMFDEKLAAAPVTEQEAAPEYEGRAKGVIRNLMQGHFKGVADVRLRINFHEELMALEQGQVAQALAPQTGSLQNLAADLEELKAQVPDSRDLTLALQESGFEQDVQQMLDSIAALLGAEGLSAGQAQAAAGELAGAFERIEVFLGAWLAPAEEPAQEDLLKELPAGAETAAAETAAGEAPVEEPAVTDETQPAGDEASTPAAAAGGEEPVAEALDEPDAFMETVTAFLEKWAAVLPELLTTLQQGLAGVATLPPLSEPHGNGKAYDKFVATYERLYAHAATPAPQEEAAGLDVVA